MRCVICVFIDADTYGFHTVPSFFVGPFGHKFPTQKKHSFAEPDSHGREEVGHPSFKRHLKKKTLKKKHLQCLYLPFYFGGILCLWAIGLRPCWVTDGFERKILRPTRAVPQNSPHGARFPRRIQPTSEVFRPNLWGFILKWGDLPNPRKSNTRN